MNECMNGNIRMLLKEEVTGMETVKIIQFNAAKCKGHYDCERACSQVHFKDDIGGEHSAIRIIRTTETDGGGPGGDDYVMTNCNHCGLCIDMCPVQAIKRLPNGNVILNKNICVGCQACVAFCSRNVMRKAVDRIEPFKCISCGACVKACPEGALELVEVKIADVSEEVYSRQGVCE
jgi:anaerobic carbon-monoxide dehydrogenase iron sulfur subunit